MFGKRLVTMWSLAALLLPSLLSVAASHARITRRGLNNDTNSHENETFLSHERNNSRLVARQFPPIDRLLQMSNWRDRFLEEGIRLFLGEPGLQIYGAVGPIFRGQPPPDMVDLSNESIRQIGDIVRETVDLGILETYVARTQAVTQRLNRYVRRAGLIFNNMQEINEILNDIQSVISYYELNIQRLIRCNRAWQTLVSMEISAYAEMKALDSLTLQDEHVSRHVHGLVRQIYQNFCEKSWEMRQAYRPTRLVTGFDSREEYPDGFDERCCIDGRFGETQCRWCRPFREPGGHPDCVCQRTARRVVLVRRGWIDAFAGNVRTRYYSTEAWQESRCDLNRGSGIIIGCRDDWFNSARNRLDQIVREDFESNHIGRWRNRRENVDVVFGRDFDGFQSQMLLRSYEPFYRPWRCLPATSPRFVPVQFNRDDGDIQCLSTDARNCRSSDTLEGCRGLVESFSNRRNLIRPLVCGEMLQRLFGFSGYDNPLHWCAIGRSNLTRRPEAFEAFRTGISENETLTVLLDGPDFVTSDLVTLP